MDEQHNEDDRRDEGDRSEIRNTVRAPETYNRGRQTVGALIGAAIVLIVGTIAKQLGWSGANLVHYVIWGAVIGALFRSSDALERAGHTLTRRDGKWLNIVVALIGMVVIFAVFFALSRGLLALLARFE